MIGNLSEALRFLFFDDLFFEVFFGVPTNWCGEPVGVIQLKVSG